MFLSIPSAFFILVLSWFDTAVRAQGDSALWTSWIPMAVRSPYLSYWMNTTNVPFNASNVDGVVRAPTVWSQFLQGPQSGWTGAIRIDETRIFLWLGNDGTPSGLNRSILTNIQITPTRTILNMTAGPLDLTVTFLSPIEPADPVLQSLPFTYLTLEATSNDGQQHNVQVLSDITAEWLSGNRTAIVNWVSQTTDTIVYHQIDLETPEALAEINNQAEDDTVFYAMQLSPQQTYMVNTAPLPQFQTTGALTNQVLSGPMPISSPFPTFSISVDLGNISATSEPLVWAVGLMRNPAIGYFGADPGADPGNTTQRSPYWASQFNVPLDAATTFVLDYPNALSRAVALDQKVLTAAANVSAHYADLVSLAARQVMGGTELTIGRSTSDPNSWNTSDVKMFMKDVGNDGRVSPVEGLYSAFPFFLYINATYCGWLLDPILEWASSSGWGLPYAPRDIGTMYPNATGDSVEHNQRVEQSGNMLIMTLAHARASGDGSLIHNYYTLLKNWTDYLVDNTMPLSASQKSADTGDSKSNLTNLALKGIIGIKAMSEISAAMKLTSDAQHYSSISSTLAAQWQSQAVSSDGQHILTSFGDPDSSWALTYNLFADKLLKTNVISSSLYASQTAFLKTQIAGSSGGLQIDIGLPGQANTAWSLFAAGYADDSSVQESLIDQIWGRVSSNATDTGIFSTNYNLNNTSVSDTASPLIGGVFAPLSLNVANVTIMVPANTNQALSPSPSSSTSTPKKSTNVGAIVGGIIGGLSGAAILGFVGFIFWRRRHRVVASQGVEKVDLETEPMPFPYGSSYQPVPDRPSESATEMSLTFPQAIPAKAREAVLEAQIARGPAPSASAHSASSGATSSQNPPTEVSSPPSSSNAVSPSDVLGLRTEVENLRRVMQTLQEGQYEPPPGYEPEQEP